MHRRIVVVLAVIAALSSTSLATAATAKKHTVKLHTTVLAHAVGTANGQQIVAGSTADPRFGNGATVYLVGSGAVQTAKFTQWTNLGSVHGTTTITETKTPSGDFALAGTGKVTGGAGKFKHATGKLTVVGSIAAATGVISITVTGTLTY